MRLLKHLFIKINYKGLDGSPGLNGFPGKKGEYGPKGERGTPGMTIMTI